MAPHPLTTFRRQSLGVPLVTLVQDYESRIIAAYKVAGFDDVMRSHGAVLRHLGDEGACISDIAARAGITKQTIGRIVRELERRGYVSVRPSTQDRRVRLVRFSPRGEQLVACSATAIEAIRGFYSEVMGRDGFAGLCRDLEQSVSRLGIDLAFLSAHGSGADRFYHFGRLMVDLADDFEHRLAQYVAPRDLPSRPMLALLYGLEPGGSSVSGLAKGLPVTVQAVSFTVRQMARDGWLEVRESRDDSRAKTVRLSAAGERRLVRVNSALEAVREDYVGTLGERRLRRLERELRALAAALVNREAIPVTDS